MKAKLQENYQKCLTDKIKRSFKNKLFYTMFNYVSYTHT